MVIGKAVMKIIKWIFLIIIGNLIFGFTALFFSTVLIPIFITIFTILMIVLFFKFSKLLLKGIVLLFVVYLILTLVPFPKCFLEGVDSNQECTCVGFEKEYNEYSECIGFAKDYACSTTFNETLVVENDKCIDIQ